MADPIIYDAEIIESPRESFTPPPRANTNQEPPLVATSPGDVLAAVQGLPISRQARRRVQKVADTAAILATGVDAALSVFAKIKPHLRQSIDRNRPGNMFAERQIAEEERQRVQKKER